MRWADDDYMSSYFSVSPTESVLSGLSEFEAESGIVSFGALGSVDFPLGGPWGVIAYARYDRLVGDAGDAPLVRSEEGSRDQFGAGIGVSYEFGFDHPSQCRTKAATKFGTLQFVHPAQALKIRRSGPLPRSIRNCEGRSAPGTWRRTVPPAATSPLLRPARCRECRC